MKRRYNEIAQITSSVAGFFGGAADADSAQIGGVLARHN